MPKKKKQEKEMDMGLEDEMGAADGESEEVPSKRGPALSDGSDDEDDLLEDYSEDDEDELLMDEGDDDSDADAY